MRIDDPKVREFLDSTGESGIFQHLSQIKQQLECEIVRNILTIKVADNLFPNRVLTAAAVAKMNSEYFFVLFRPFGNIWFRYKDGDVQTGSSGNWSVVEMEFFIQAFVGEIVNRSRGEESVQAGLKAFKAGFTQ